MRRGLVLVLLAAATAGPAAAQPTSFAIRASATFQRLRRGRVVALFFHVGAQGD